MLQNQVTFIFNHAERFYGLKDNPCKKIDKMGKANAKELSFWTKSEHDIFIQNFDEKEEMYRMVYQMLFWFGCRIGELLTLTKGDISFENSQNSITKTYYCTGRQDVITELKTKQSVRTVEIPEFLKKEIAPTVATVRAVITGKPLLSVFHNSSIAEIFPVTTIFRKWRVYGRYKNRITVD